MPHDTPLAASRLGRLVAALPELYQPIFGHPELSRGASRAQDRRLAEITALHDRLRAHLGRQLRVLDLGCAQGFFSLALAERGASVEGIDFQSPNLAVCQALAAEHPDFALSFREADIARVLAELAPGHYDLVLGLSVFHHLVHRAGLAAVLPLIARMAERIELGIFELAQAEEPLYWAAAQPRDPRDLLAPFAFVHEIARHPTHLSALARPLLVASNHHWLLGERIGSFQSWTAASHALAVGAASGSRRYFFGDGAMVKLMRLDAGPGGAVNLREFHNEVALLEAPPPGLTLPTMAMHGVTEGEAWIVRDLIPGELLLDRILGGRPYDAEQVLLQVLDQLAALEQAGLHHDDLRVWNVLITPDEQAVVIDYGSVWATAVDHTWPDNVLLSFMIFAAEVLGRSATRPAPLRPHALNPDAFPEPWRSRFWSLLEQPAANWSFTGLRALCAPGAAPVGDRSGLATMMQAMAQAIAIHQHFASRYLGVAQKAVEALKSVQPDSPVATALDPTAGANLVVLPS